MSFRWWSSCRTDTGRRRRVNEDAYLSMDDLGLWVVADGMGGHTRGNVASRIVVETFDGLIKPPTMREFANLVKTRLWEANRRMQEEVRAMGANDIMGSTVVAFLVHKREWMCLWAGDSRAYLLRDGRLTQLTRDHNVAQEMVERGELDRAAATGHPSANRITRAVGVGEELYLDEYRSFLRDGDAVLLCSDGLNKEVDDGEVEEILESFDCQEASRELMDLSLERGARDNVTVAVIRFEATTGFGETRSEDTDVNYGMIERGTGVQGHQPGLYPRLEYIRLAGQV